MFRGNFLMTQISERQAIRIGSFGFLIPTLARKLDARMKDELETVGVDIKLFAKLMMLAEKDGINQRTLGDKLNFPEYFMSRNVDALVSAGYAERRPDPNSRRAFLIFLTNAGKAKAKELPPIIHRVNDEILGDLSEDDRTSLINMLQQVAGSARS